MTFNTDVALKNTECKATNISLRFIQTLQEAASESGNNVLYINNHPRSIEVDITIDIDDEKLNIHEIETEELIESVSLKHYTYILGVLILS